jgi:hypothetical protein
MRESNRNLDIPPRHYMESFSPVKRAEIASRLHEQFQPGLSLVRAIYLSSTWAEMSARAEIIWVSRNRTISVLRRFFEAIRRWLVHHLTCVRLWLYVKYLKIKQTRKIKPFKRLFFSPGWNYLRLHACRAEISARETRLKTLHVFSP